MTNGSTKNERRRIPEIWLSRHQWIDIHNRPPAMEHTSIDVSGHYDARTRHAKAMQTAPFPTHDTFPPYTKSWTQKIATACSSQKWEGENGMEHDRKFTALRPLRTFGRTKNYCTASVRVLDDCKLHARRLFDSVMTLNYTQDAYSGLQWRQTTSEETVRVFNHDKLAMRANGTSANGFKLGWQVWDGSKLPQNTAWRVRNGMKPVDDAVPSAMTLNYHGLDSPWWLYKLITAAHSEMAINEKLYVTLHNFIESINGHKISHTYNNRPYCISSRPTHT